MGMARYVWLPAIVVVGAVVAGIGGACSAAALVILGVKYWRSRRDARRCLDHATSFSRAVRLLVAELRAGAHPTAAAEGAAADAAPEVSRLLRELASTSRLDADVTTVLNSQYPVGLRAPVDRLVRAWALAQRYGVALADLLDAVRRDVECWAAFFRDKEAKMAGPRATAAVLSGLPVLGLLLGEGAGAGPVAVLTGTLFGQMVLVVGVGLLCMGLLWTMRLTEAAVRS
jgi:tight adherence protein B